MAVSSLMRSVFQNQILGLHSAAVTTLHVPLSRNVYTYRVLPKPGVKGKSYRRIVHYEETYTVKPLKTTNLGGRDPVSGRVIAGRIGGGVKHPYHWIKWIREGPTDLSEPPREDRVLNVFKDGNRTAHVALIGHKEELCYILATQNMKPGDLIKTHRGIPPNPLRPNEGDAYPLGALPTGTEVCCIEKYPGTGGSYVHAAGTFGTVMKTTAAGQVVVKMPSKKLFGLPPESLAVVGRLSNPEHGSTPIGSPQKNRELGNRPKSGLKQKKTGRFGRKIRHFKKVEVIKPKPVDPTVVVKLDLPNLN